jgi:hypothetical protein
VALLVLLVSAGRGYQATAAIARSPGRADLPRTAAAVSSSAQAHARTDKAPSSAPLTSSQADPAGGAADGEEGPTPQGEVDPLVSNGLGSPSCKGELLNELSSMSRRNCETSGFAAAPAPTGDYGIDVHIDEGLLNTTAWGSTIAQDMFVTPLWTGLVWAVHALIVIAVKLSL